MNKQIVQPVKGTRDFYPEQMAFRNYLYGKIREFAEKFGYQEVDGPILEYFDLYANKTSQEILEGQTFTISARGEQTIILRPEFTPTYARMVAQRSQELLKPIRWFSFGIFPAGSKSSGTGNSGSRCGNYSYCHPVS